MSIKIIVTVLIFYILAINTFQDEKSLNHTDSQGRKQGHWIKKYPNGNIMYEGFFKDDHPAGELKRYYENKVLKSLLIFSDDRTEASAVLYYPNGYKASEGRYIRQLKDGKWRFFSSVTEGLLISEEEYANDKIHGWSVKYYPDSVIAEKQYFSAGIKNGDWIKYHPGGSLHFKTNYQNGRLHGKFEAFFEDGRPEVTGQYKNDRKEGTWFIYRKDGSVKFKTEYISGLPKNREIDLYETNYIDSLENLKVRIEDPEKTGAKW
jgi:antitoxin component YwqK of YwqJK toxin-antitoxin module